MKKFEQDYERKWPGNAMEVCFRRHKQRVSAASPHGELAS